MATAGEGSGASAPATGSTMVSPEDRSAAPSSEEKERLPWMMPSAQEITKALLQLSTAHDKERAWAKTADEVKRYSDEVIKEWNEEIDYFLVYSGIFSGILTAFVISTYPTLQSSSSSPVSLARVQSHEESPQLADARLPSSLPWSVVATNALFFFSLVCGLVATFFGLMVKQWLHDYRSINRGTARHTARLRWFRINNTIKWRVAHIISLLFILLQISFVLFFAGLLVLLWAIYRPLALAMTLLIGVVGILLVITTILPVIHTTCCYLSPITYSLFNLYRRMRNALRKGPLRLLVWCSLCVCTSLFRRSTAPWMKRLKEWLSTKKERLHGVSSADSTWQEREVKSISETSERLDMNLVIATVLGRLAKDSQHATSDSVNEVVLHLMADLKPAMASECLSEVYNAVDEELRMNPRAKDAGLNLASTIPLDFWIAALPKMIAYIVSGPSTHEQRDSSSEPQNAVFGRRLWPDGMSNLGALGRVVLRTVHLVPATDNLDQIEKAAVAPRNSQSVDPKRLQQFEKHVFQALEYIARGIQYRDIQHDVSQDRRLLLILSWCTYTIGGESRAEAFRLLHRLLCAPSSTNTAKVYSWDMIRCALLTLESRFWELLDRFAKMQTASPATDDLGPKFLRNVNLIVFCSMKPADFWEGHQSVRDAAAAYSFAERVLEFFSPLLADGALLGPSGDFPNLSYIGSILTSIVDVLAESRDGRILHAKVLDRHGVDCDGVECKGLHYHGVDCHLDNADCHRVGHRAVSTWLELGREKIPMLAAAGENPASDSLRRLGEALVNIEAAMANDAKEEAAMKEAIKSASVLNATASG